MSNYKYVFNPISGEMDKVYDVSLLTIKGAVDTTADLPLTGNTESDCWVVKADDSMYTWNSTESSGTIDKWVNIGDCASVQWSAIQNKPSSSVSNIDDAVSKKHTQNADTDLDATFEATFVKKVDTVNVLSDITSAGADIESAVSLKHDGGTQDTAIGLNTTHRGLVTGNPHVVTKTEVGLGNVDNKSEATIITDVKADVDVADAITKKHAQNSDTDLDATFEATFVKKVDTVNALSDITSAGADIEDAVTKKHAQGTDTALGSMASNVDMNSHKLTSLSVPSSNGDSIRATTKITESNLESVVDNDHVAVTVAGAPLTLSTQEITFNYDTNHFGLSGNNLQIKADGIDDTLIDWGIGANQVVTKNFIDYADSSQIISGGEVSEGSNAGTFKVAALTAMLRATDSVTGALTYVTLAEQDNQSITAANTIYIVTLNYNGGSPTITLSLTHPYDADKRNISLGKVHKDGSNNVHFISSGNRLQDGVRKLHKRVRTLREIELDGGSTIAYSGTNNFTMTEGIFFAGLNEFSTGAYDSASTQFTPIYRDGGAGWTEGSLSNTLDYAHYDDGDGTLGNVGVSKYAVFFVYIHVSDGHVYVQYGQSGSYSLAQAEAAEVPTTANYVSSFGTLIGKIIMPQAGGSFSLVQMITDTVFTAVNASDHNLLGNLNTGDYMHLESAEHTELTQWLDDVTLGASGALTLPTGQNFTIGSTQWNSGDSIDADSIVDGSANAVMTLTQETNFEAAYSAMHTQGTDTALGAQAENLDMNTHKIVGVVDPVDNQDAATKKYVDDNGIVWAESLSGITGDGLTLSIDTNATASLSLINLDTNNANSDYNVNLLYGVVDANAGSGVNSGIFIISNNTTYNWGASTPPSGTGMHIYQAGAQGTALSIAGCDNVNTGALVNLMVSDTQSGASKILRIDLGGADQAIEGIKVVGNTANTGAISFHADMETGFGGDFIKCDVNNVEKFSVDKDGNVVMAASSLTINSVIVVGTDGEVNKAAVEDSGNWDSAYSHVSNNGSDHSYIDQDVTGTASPDFGGLTVQKANAKAIVYIDTYDEDNSNYSQLFLRKSADESLGSKTPTADTEILGSISIQGVDNANGFSEGFVLTATQDGSVGSFVPTTVKMETYTNAGINRSQFVLDQDGSVMLGDATYSCGSFKMIKGAQTSDPQVEFSMSEDVNGDFTITTSVGDIILSPALNVGIGTSTPGGKLCVNGGVTVGSDTDPGDNNLRVEGTVLVNGTIGAGTPAANTLYKDNITKGWIQFNGIGTIAIQGSFNVSSITDNGVGDYTVNWDVDFANDDYAVSIISGSGANRTNNIETIATTALGVVFYDPIGAAVADVSIVCVMAIGDQ